MIDTKSYASKVNNQEINPTLNTLIWYFSLTDG